MKTYRGGRGQAPRYRQLPARFNSVCKVCQKPIRKGEDIWYDTWGTPKPLHKACRPTED